jgi:hypothetical protein
MQNFIKNIVLKTVPTQYRGTVLLRLFGLAKVSLIWYVRASVVHFDPNMVKVKIPLNRRTRNHLGSMYFGTLAVGADCAGGILAVTKIYQNDYPIDIVFKDFHAEFFKRLDGDTVFTCSDGEALSKAVDEAVATKERINIPLKVLATVPDKYGEEVLAQFALTLSMKYRTR